MTNEKEQRIKEQRTIEATKKGYMGLSGKFACIAKNLGSKIVSETSNDFSSNPLPDVWELDTEKDPFDGTVIHDSDENDWSRCIGFIFDGLNRSMHLEIKYLTDEKSLTVYHKGYLVYRETCGDLEAFVPGDWEKDIEKLLVIAKKIAYNTKQEENAEGQKQVDKKYKQFLEYLKKRWGF